MSINGFLKLVSRRKAWVASAAVVVVVAAGAVILWAGFRGPPDPAKQTSEQVLEYVASESFAKLSDSQKQDYLTRAREEGRLDMRQVFRAEGLSDEQREQLSRNMADAGRQRMRQMQEQVMDDYFELPPEERGEYLDRIIDRMRERPMRPTGDDARSGTTDRQDRTSAARDDESPSRGEGRRRGRTTAEMAERMKRRIEHSDPENRARFSEFMRALRERMEQRGITPRGPRRGR